MKTIKSMTQNNMTITMTQYGNDYYLLVNNMPVSTSPDFSYISTLFDKWIKEI
jgi:hypothetical protein